MKIDDPEKEEFDTFSRLQKWMQDITPGPPPQINNQHLNRIPSNSTTDSDSRNK